MSASASAFSKRRDAYPLHDVETAEGTDKVDAAEDDLRHEQVRDTDGREDRRAVVEVICAP